MRDRHGVKTEDAYLPTIKKFVGAGEILRNLANLTSSTKIRAGSLRAGSVSDGFYSVPGSAWDRTALQALPAEPAQA